MLEEDLKFQQREIDSQAESMRLVTKKLHQEQMLQADLRRQLEMQKAIQKEQLLKYEIEIKFLSQLLQERDSKDPERNQIPNSPPNQLQITEPNSS